jgi:hypothetical protein
VCWRLSGMRAVAEDPTGLPLKDPDDVDGLNKALVLRPLVVRELALVTLLGKLINCRLIIGRGPELDKRSREVSGRGAIQGVEKSFEDRSRLCPNHDLIVSRTTLVRRARFEPDTFSALTPFPRRFRV